jgi:hypothetical protein
LERIIGMLDEAREQHLFLVLVTEAGLAFPQSLLISLVRDAMHIDKPLDWDDSITTFRVFFRSKGGRWLFFKAENAQPMPFSLFVEVPAQIGVLQRRSHPRIKVPQGTKAIVKKDGRMLNSFYVRDISPAGMLVCTASPSSGLSLESVLNDIVIALPDNGTKLGRLLTPIDQGQVVRTFFEEESNIHCHGIAFNYESAYVREALARIAGPGNLPLPK